MTRAYLAAPYQSREQMTAYAAEVRRIGYDVVSTWHDETHEITPEATGPANAFDDTTANGFASKDLAEIDLSDVFVVFTEKAVDIERSTGGRHIETGYALANAKVILLVGEPETVFHRLTRVNRVPDWHQATLWLAQYLVRRGRSRIWSMTRDR